jgi:hypothetical protein
MGPTLNKELDPEAAWGGRLVKMSSNVVAVDSPGPVVKPKWELRNVSSNRPVLTAGSGESSHWSEDWEGG